MTEPLSLEIVAEGVEEQDQVDFLLNSTTHQVQGYFYSPPVDTDKCTDLLKKKPFIRKAN